MSVVQNGLEILEVDTVTRGRCRTSDAGPMAALPLRNRCADHPRRTGRAQVKLTPTGRKLLRRAKQHIKITAKGTFTPTSKAAISKIVTLTLRR